MTDYEMLKDLAQRCTALLFEIRVELQACPVCKRHIMEEHVPGCRYAELVAGCTVILREEQVTMSKVDEHEPDPVPGKEAVYLMVLQDIQDRVNMGYEKHGGFLMTFNGRNSMMDAYQELLDLVMYFRQAIAEKSNDSDLAAYIHRHEMWSAETFGHGVRTEGICKHIESELAEIREKPHDLIEWVDVIILALDGAWRAGYSPREIVDALNAKQAVNRTRHYDRVPEDQPAFHRKG